MDYKIIGWVIASFNSAFNGNNMVHGNQMVAPNNNAYPVASSSIWNNRADAGDPNGIIGQNGWTEDEEGAKYASFVKKHIDPNAVITPEEKLIGGWMQQQRQAPMDPSSFTRWEAHQPNRQIRTQRPPLDCTLDVDRIERGSSHRLVKRLTAPRSGVRFEFKFDKSLSDDEIKDMIRDFEEAINNYEQQIGLPSSPLLHKVYVDKWNQAKGRNHGMHQVCHRKTAKGTMDHLMGVYLGGLEHGTKHEMGHVLHNVHTQGVHISLLIGDGIAQHCSLSDEQKREAAKETLELFQRNGSFFTINSIKQLCEKYGGYDRYEVGPTLIQYIQYYYKDRLKAYLACEGEGNIACINDLNIDMEHFKTWLKRKVSVDQAKSYVPPIPTGEPVTRATRHAAFRDDRRWQPTMPTVHRDDRRPQPHGCASVAYLDLACDAEKCSVIRESARQYHVYTHHHTEDCTNVSIQNQIPPHTREEYRCMGGWSKWIHQATKSSGRLPASVKGHIKGCNLISSSAVTATGATPTDGASSDGSHSIYWVPATIVGGVASSAALCMGKKFYNKYCW